MRRTQLYLDESERQVLDEQSSKTGKSVGQLIREAVDEVYGVHHVQEQPLSSDDPILGFIGSGESKEHDVSEKHDHYLYGAGE